MDFDLNQVSLVTPPSLNLSKRNSANGINVTDTRFDSSTVGSVYHDDAEKLHSDLIGIEETDEMCDKIISHNSCGTSLSYTKQQHAHINTSKESTNSCKAHNNIIPSEGKCDSSKEHNYLERNGACEQNDMNSLQTLSNTQQPLFKAISIKQNEKQVSFRDKNVIIVFT